MLLDAGEPIGKLVQLVMSSSNDDYCEGKLSISTFDMIGSSSNTSILDDSQCSNDQYSHSYHEESLPQSIAPSLILAPSPFAASNEDDDSICGSPDDMVVDDQDCVDDEDTNVVVTISDGDYAPDHPTNAKYDANSNTVGEMAYTGDNWNDLDEMLDDAFKDCETDLDDNSSFLFDIATRNSFRNSRILPITIPISSIADYDSDEDDEEISNAVIQPRVPLTDDEEQERDYQRLLDEWSRAEVIKPKVANYWKAIGFKHKSSAIVVPVHENRKPATVTFAYNLCRIRRFSWQEEPTRLQTEEVIEDKSLKGFDDVADVFIRSQPAFRITKPKMMLGRKEGHQLRKAVMSKDVVDNAYSIWKECMGTVCDELVCSSVVLRKEKAVNITKSNKSTSPRKDGHLIGNYEVFQSSPLRYSVIADEDEDMSMHEDVDSSIIPDLLSFDKEISPPLLKRKRFSPLSPVPSSQASSSDGEESCGAPSTKRPKVVRLVDPTGKCSIKLRLCLAEKNN